MPLLVITAQSDYYIKTTARLLRHGADPDVASAHGTTPLWQAAFHCAPKTVELLLYWNANPNNTLYQHNPAKLTPLHMACRPQLDSFDTRINSARIEVVEWLCAAEADTNARDNHGRTPLFGLTAGYHENRSSTLLSPRKKKIFHETRKLLINTLLQCKANPTLQDIYGNSAITQKDLYLDSYLSIYTAWKLSKRREKLCELLLKFLSSAQMKPSAVSPFKNIPCDIIRYILTQTYP